MSRLFPLIVTALAVFVLPQTLLADDPRPVEEPAADQPAERPITQRPAPKPERPDPAKLFKRLDANHDNQLSPEEFAEGMKGLRRFRSMQGGPMPSHGGHGMVPPECPMGPHGGGPDALPPPLYGPADRPEGPPPWGPMGNHDRPGGPHPGPWPDRAPAWPEHKLMIVRLLDMDHDGAISGREIILANARLMRLDRNQDGLITQDELMACPWGRHGRHGAKHGPMDRRPFRQAMVERFNQADANHDGQLSPEEAPQCLKEHFSKVDVNADGQVTLEEWKAAAAKRIEDAAKHRARPRHGDGKRPASDKPAPQTSDAPNTPTP